ncbi:unnamed protein product [Ambrosiozyma monospora]|uniref:Unnamed protein product n=1 Tax=Ambrosiozyma monospora TaxID=43982 RepID=A0ACB5UC50_AMBMO|nr:unnamed protein product [Ambrosiozyma monospora]
MSVSSSSRKRSESLSSNKNSGSAALEEKMDKYLVREDWIGKIEGDELKMGTFHVKVEGLYAFVFDNTFSRHKAKTIMFNQYIENGDNEHASMVSTDITSKTVGAPDLHTIDEDGAKETAPTTTATTAPPSADRSHVKFELVEDNDNIKTATIIRVKAFLCPECEIRCFGLLFE